MNVFISPSNAYKIHPSLIDFFINNLGIFHVFWFLSLLRKDNMFLSKMILDILSFLSKMDHSMSR